MNKQNWSTKRSLLVRILLGTFILLFILIELKDGKLQWRNGTGFEEGKIITTNIEKTPDGKIIKTVITEKAEPGKTLWDLLQLAGTLAVPILIAILGFRFQEQQQQRAIDQAEREKRIAADRAEQESQIAYEIKMSETGRAEIHLREEALQNYLDRIADVLIDKKLLALADRINFTEEGQEDKAVLLASLKLIRAWTLSILRRLDKDKDRKRSVIQFLVDADIVGKLNLSLANTNLRQANLSGIDLSGVDLNSADLGGVNLSEANLSNANLSNANLNSAILSKTNLSKANLTKASLKNVYFYTFEVNLSGADLSKAQLGGANLSEANLSKAKLIGAKTEQKIELIRANLTDADLSGANLIDADLSNADLERANLKNANLEGANLSEAKLNNAKLIGTKLNRADLTKAVLYDADLTDADLENAVMTEADLSYANFVKVNNLKPTQVHSARFTHAKFAPEFHQELNLVAADNQQVTYSQNPDD